MFFRIISRFVFSVVFCFYLFSKKLNFKCVKYYWVCFLFFFLLEKYVLFSWDDNFVVLCVGCNIDLFSYFNYISWMIFFIKICSLGR